MKCSKIQRLIVEYEDREMPAEIAAHLTGCSACKREYERSVDLQKLVSLKRYEKPSPEADERRVLSIHRTIQEAIDPRPGEAERNAWGWLAFEPLPALRYAIAAVLIAVVGIHLFVMPKLQPTDEIAVSTPTQIEPGETQPMYAEDTPPYQSELYAELQAMQPVTNVYDGSIQYGPQRSTVVDYEY